MKEQLKLQVCMLILSSLQRGCARLGKTVVLYIFQEECTSFINLMTVRSWCTSLINCVNVIHLKPTNKNNKKLLSDVLYFNKALVYIIAVLNGDGE